MSCPPTAPSPGAPLPSAGSLGSVPQPHRSYEGATTPCRPSHRTSFPSLGGTVPRPSLRSRRWPSAAPAGQGFGLPGPIPAAFGRRRQGLPGSWVIPNVRLPCSSTPERPDAPGQFSAQVLSTPVLTTLTLSMRSFRGSITRPSHSLSTLRRAGHPATAQDSLPAGGQPLPGGTYLPAGFTPEGFTMIDVPFTRPSTSIPLLQASPGATRPDPID